MGIFENVYLKKRNQGSVRSIAFKICIWFSFTVLAYMGSSTLSLGQSQKRIVQLSGVVLAEDSISGVPGVHVYVPKAGRGTTTNHMGFFSMPVLVGDSIVISSVGYQRQHYIVPSGGSEYQTIIITLVPDVTFLREIEIVPFPTEEVFKEAILALNIPPKDEQVNKNFNEELLALMLQTTPLDGRMNQRYSLEQWANSQTDRYHPVTNPFLNPFNWAKFFKSLKDKKK